MPVAEACAAMLVWFAAAANEVAPTEPPPAELLMYLAEFEQDPVALEAAMSRDEAAAPTTASTPRATPEPEDESDAPR